MQTGSASTYTPPTSTVINDGDRVRAMVGKVATGYRDGWNEAVDSIFRRAINYMAPPPDPEEDDDDP